MDKKTEKIKLDIPESFQGILRQAGSLGDSYKYKVFAVGGFVRDLLIGRSNLDIDIVVEGHGLKFAEGLSDKLNGSLITHEQFGTATIQALYKVDIATARSECYRSPAAYPSVKSGKIRDDLKRRDFTINAMACSLNKDNFGEVLDTCGGRQDIEKKIIRVLHDKSFNDDPTRIFRAVRFEQRYNFTLDKKTESLIRMAACSGMIDRLSRQRIEKEIALIEQEKRALRIFSRLKGLTGEDYVKGR